MPVPKRANSRTGGDKSCAEVCGLARFGEFSRWLEIEFALALELQSDLESNRLLNRNLETGAHHETAR